MKAHFLHLRRGMTRWLVASIGLCAVICAVATRGLEPVAPPLALKTPDGFAVPQSDRLFQFPRDHGSHPEFKIEWWYVTGHLRDDQGDAYGFQATFFRQSGPHANTSTNAAAAGGFGSSQLFLAHMAWLDVRRQQFIHQERLNRDGWDAHAETMGLAVTNGPWSLSWIGQGDAPRMMLRGGIRNEISFEFKLEPTKPLVSFGERGVSRKAADPTAASHYLTFPRIKVSGVVRDPSGPHADRERAVQGWAWMDHEMGSSQLGTNQAGWDWACLQLDDGREVMAYRMRGRDGTTDPFSTLAWVTKTGGVERRSAEQFRWIGRAGWKSKTTGAEYPNRVTIETIDPETGRLRQFQLEPLALGQELTGELGGVAYWEGACAVLDEGGHRIGQAFLELTGYSGDLSSRFR